MKEPLYPAARTYAARVAAHFSRQAAACGHDARQGAPLPDEGAIEALVDNGFWASLHREEGYSPEISLAFLPPEQAVRPMMLAAPIPLGPHALARLAPAVKRPGIHLGVWRDRTDFVVWGTTRAVPSFALVLEVLGPGRLVVKHRVREDSAKFRNVAVFEGELVKVLGGESAPVADHPLLLRSLLAPAEAAGESVDVLIRLAVSMRAHRRGGTLLVVPAGSEAWRDSIVRPIAYAVEPPFRDLADLVEAEAGGPPHDTGLLSRAVDTVAGLTAVDGATVITDRYELLAFGVKIGRPDSRPQLERVVVTEPVEGAGTAVVVPTQLGGTRHISAAQFAQDQREAVALVASQDGRFTLFAWSPAEGMVHGHRVETLLV